MQRIGFWVLMLLGSMATAAQAETAIKGVPVFVPGKDSLKMQYVEGRLVRAIPRWTWSGGAIIPLLDDTPRIPLRGEIQLRNGFGIIIQEEEEALLGFDSEEASPK